MARKGLMNNPVRIVSDMKMVKQGILARMMCRFRKHRVVKSGGDITGYTWTCARQRCEWTRNKSGR